MCGVCSVVWGVALVSSAAGFIVGGAMLLWLARSTVTP